LLQQRSIFMTKPTCSGISGGGRILRATSGLSQSKHY
jgi:hypothetical protein